MAMCGSCKGSGNIFTRNKQGQSVKKKCPACNGSGQQ